MSFSLFDWAENLNNDDSPALVQSVSYGNDELQQTSAEYMYDCNTQFMMNGVTSCVHFVVETAEGAYVDVTPPDPGDEGRPSLFVPSSRVYAGLEAHDITALLGMGCEPRMGLVCSPRRWHDFRQTLQPHEPGVTGVNAPSAAELVLWAACRSLSGFCRTFPEVTPARLEKMGAVVSRRHDDFVAPGAPLMKLVRSLYAWDGAAGRYERRPAVEPVQGRVVRIAG